MSLVPNLCTPAQVFVVFETIHVLFRIFFPKKERPLLSRLKIFILYALLIIGWTTVINYSCDSSDNNYVAWFLVLIPSIFGMLIWKK